MSKEELPLIVFSDFNQRRFMRGANAARFDFVDEQGETFWMWMSKEDIKGNIVRHPHCREELEKGMAHYNT